MRRRRREGGGGLDVFRSVRIVNELGRRGWGQSIVEAWLDFVHLFLFGLAFGIGAAVPIGPINTEIARRSLKHGPGMGVAFGGGAVLVDMVLATAACLGIGVRLESSGIFRVMITVGGFVILTVLGLVTLHGAVKAWKAHKRAKADPEHFEQNLIPPGEGKLLNYQPRMPNVPLMNVSEANNRSAVRTFLTGFMMTAINPYTLMFWFVVLPAVASKQITEASRDLPALLGGVFAGTFGWVVAFSGLMGYLKRWSKDWWVILADLVGGAALLTFAVLALLSLIEGPARELMHHSF